MNITRHRRLLQGGMTAVLGAVLLTLMAAANQRDAPVPAYRGESSAVEGIVTELLSPEAVVRVERFCGDCHAFPRPESFTRDRWHFEVRKGYEFYAKSGRIDLDPPPISTTLAYYRTRAPERMTYPRGEESPMDLTVEFEQENLQLQPVPGVLPEISHLSWAQLAADVDPMLIACDMRYGHVLVVDLMNKERRPPRILGQVRNPARTEVCDLDGDGATDLIVADLGSYRPVDHNLGRVVLLKGRTGSDGYEAVELATGLGRVADVRPADFDRDGRIDLVVAEFGWHETGSIRLLKNVSTAGERLEFESVVIDNRPGTIHVPVHDFNGDGRPDVAALVSQEYEAIELYLNQGDLHFNPARVWSAPDLTFGSSGIELCDLNQDGALDVLYTNGDAFDNSYVPPWHGVQWLENVGGAFVSRRLTDLPGAFRALGADFDVDGDQDVVAVAWLPLDARPAELKAHKLASIVFLEQRGAGAFARHTLQWDAPFYASLAVGDFDDDGKPDFAVASGPNVADGRGESHSMTVWWNRTDGRARSN